MGSRRMDCLQSQALVVSATAPTGLLPATGDGAWVVHHQCNVERADVDA